MLSPTLYRIVAFSSDGQKGERCSIWGLLPLSTRLLLPFSSELANCSVRTMEDFHSTFTPNIHPQLSLT